MLAVVGCGTSVPEPPESTDPARSGGLTGTLTIFAAASLTESFSELTDAFAAEHPGVSINPISFDGSSTLATQIREGAPADVFASANVATMRSVAEHVAGTPVVFALNTVQLVVQPGNPLGITRLADLAEPDVQVVLCAPAVPCGAAAARLFELGGVSVTAVSEEQNVKAVVTKVREGEADVGVVYATDALAEPGVHAVVIDGAESVSVEYEIAVLEEAAFPEAARAFVDFVSSDAGRAVLARYGFGAP